MKQISKTALGSLALCLLAACSSGGHGSARTENNSRTESSARQESPAAPSGNVVTSSSGACKLLADYGGRGKNKVFRCDVRAVLQDSVTKGDLESGIPVGFGTSGKYRTNATARAFGNDEAASCERAVTNALKSLQGRVKKEGGRSMTQVASYKAGANGRFEANAFAPSGYADCIVATFQSRTVMRGSVGK